jgi:hypothetical protein
MNLKLLKNNLLEELKNYNYTIGSKLLFIYLTELSDKFFDDEHSREILNNFSNCINNSKNIKENFKILYEINNINILVELLCFFNPSEYYNIFNELNV